ncbi:hypothetical protein DFA_08187 [Cavenderia fasciculata]|uniref:Glycoside hydrolase family 5 domain-containing protein n=1 Tax=Cavenderia fasciculata TaxID=261658 RepID=F4Q5E1_CACFS|nr:uncharacterized protein DFA_08187 [Cavenderia fasciculata]EGG17200.1 hypothetical protein DFA_08187 [Cavenderia fasciculata]|eukprot:XP_004355684.1 hypothetical protein DFA_08187 [Cavenderia fasciculata]
MKLLLLLFVVLIVGCSKAFIQVDVNTQNLIDEYGRVRIFHGLNAVYKIFPWHPDTDTFDPQNSLCQEDIDNLVSWGFNAIRLGVMWPGVEPERDEFNQTYVNVMKGIVDTLGDNGIYTIIDFHQDLINRRFCGEGIPDWAVAVPDTRAFPSPVASPYPVDNTTLYPNLEQCLSKEFAQYYFSDQVGAAFQSLYDNVDGILDEFVKYWQLLATTFVDSNTVIGYEIINEPWGGDVYKDPLLLVDLGHADRVNLAPLYNTINRAIRDIDDQHCVMFEKSLVDVYDSQFTPGTPGGIEYNNRQILSYHIYCGTSGSGPRYIGLCDDENEVFLSGAMKDLKRLGGGGFMTEFGAIGNSTKSMEMITYMMEQADRHLQSWTYWQYKFYNDITTSGPEESLYLADGSLDVEKVMTLSRTYARAIAGEPISMYFDITTSQFLFSYKINTAITQPTEIYFNRQFHYSSGVNAQITSGEATLTIISDNIINIIPNSNTINGSIINVSISPSN